MTVVAFPTGARCTVHVWCRQCGTGQSSPTVVADEVVAAWIRMHDVAFPPLFHAHDLVHVVEVDA